jgi:YbbR domain-containing protein
LESILRRWAGSFGTFLLALVLAVIVWIVAVQEENPIEQGEFPEPIPVQVRNQPAGTTFLPSTFDEQVSLTIRAPRSTWRDLRTDKCTVWIDLEGRGPGDYEVPVEYGCTDSNIRVLELRPATVPVRLKEEISRTVPVQVQLYGSAALGYAIDREQTIIDPELVTVTGPASIVEQVNKASLDLYLRDEKETVTGVRSVVARQANGDSVGSFVTIEPSTVQITVPIVQQTGFNEVAVRPKLVGTVAAGYWLRSVTVDPLTVMLVGDPDVVSGISGFVETVPLDISGATGDVIERVALALPEGASTVGVQGALITVTVAAQQGSLTVVRRPVVRGLSTDLTARVFPEEVEITLVGPMPRLNTLVDEDVYAYVELVDKGVGKHIVDLTYLVPEGLQVGSILPATVDVEISRIVPTPAATATRARPRLPIPTAVLTSTEGITLTVIPTSTAGLTSTAGITLVAKATLTVTLTSTPANGSN